MLLFWRSARGNTATLQNAPASSNNTAKKAKTKIACGAVVAEIIFTEFMDKTAVDSLAAVFDVINLHIPLTEEANLRTSELTAANVRRVLEEGL